MPLSCWGCWQTQPFQTSGGKEKWVKETESVLKWKWKWWVTTIASDMMVEWLVVYMQSFFESVESKKKCSTLVMQYAFVRGCLSFLYCPEWLEQNAWGVLAKTWIIRMCFISDQVSSHQREEKIWVCFGLSVHSSKTYPPFVTLKFRLSYSPYLSSAKWHIRWAMPSTSPINCCEIEFAPGPLLSSVPLLLCCHGSTLPSLLFWGSGCRGGGGGRKSQGVLLLSKFVILRAP